MAVTYTPTAAWDTTGTFVTNTMYKDVTVTVAVGDLIIVGGLSANANGGTGALSQVGGTGATGTWTVGRENNVASTCGYTAGHAVATGAGTVTVRVTVPTGASTTPMGAGVYVVPAAEVTGTPNYTALAVHDADGQFSKTLTDTSKVFYIGADWSAAAPGTGITPAGGTQDAVFSNGSDYGVMMAHWDAQASGTRNYGPSAAAGNDWASVVVGVQEAGGGSFTGTATLAATGAITASGSVVDTTEPIPVSYVDAGTAPSATASATAFPLPIPTATEDQLLVAFITVKAVNAATPTATNWTLLATSTKSATGVAAGTGVGEQTTFILGRVVPAGGLSGTVTFTCTGSNSTVGRALRFSYDATGYTSPSWELAAASTSFAHASSTTWGGTGAANINVDTDDVLVVGLHEADDTARSATPNLGLTATGATLGTLVDVGHNVVTTGGDSAISVLLRPVTAGPSSAAPAATLTGGAAETGGGTFLRVRAKGVPPTGDYSGSAAVSGTGSNSSSGIVGKIAGAAVAAVVAITAAGAVGTGGSASLTGTGVISASGSVASGVSSSASIAGTGTITKTGIVGTVAAATSAGTGAITASGVVARAAAASASGTGAITAVGRVGLTSTATISGTSAITAIGVRGGFLPGAQLFTYVDVDGQPYFSETGPGDRFWHLDVDGVPYFSTTSPATVLWYADTDGNPYFVASGFVSTATISGTSVISAAGSRGASSAASTAGVGAITASGTVARASTAAVAATGAVGSTGTVGVVKGATAAGTGTRW